jgi:hypothetical protein
LLGLAFAVAVAVAVTESIESIVVAALLSISPLLCLLAMVLFAFCSLAC